MSLSRSEQARINGAKSRGPKTPEGKRISSRNSYKHGLTAQSFFVLSTEDPQGLDEIVRSLTETFKPATDLERSFITQAAGAQWRMRRLWALETEAYEHEMDDQRGHRRRAWPHL